MSYHAWLKTSFKRVNRSTVVCDCGPGTWKTVWAVVSLKGEEEKKKGETSIKRRPRRRKKKTTTELERWLSS